MHLSRVRATLLLLAAPCVAGFMGCSSLGLPAMPTMTAKRAPFAPPPSAEERYQPVGTGVAMASETLTEDVYYKVRQAKAENGVVLQIIGEDEPIRVLPLPPASGGVDARGGTGAKSVYVSTLLTQTGTLNKMGKSKAALYRGGSNAMDAVRMDIHFAGKAIRPETDYALRPGDRLVIAKDDHFSMDSIVDIALGR